MRKITSLLVLLILAFVGAGSAQADVVAGKVYTIRPYSASTQYVVPAASWAATGGNMTAYASEATAESGHWLIKSTNLTGTFSISRACDADKSGDIGYLNPWDASSNSENAVGCWKTNDGNDRWIFAEVEGHEGVYTIQNNDNKSVYMYYKADASALYFNKPTTTGETNWFYVTEVVEAPEASIIDLSKNYYLKHVQSGKYVVLGNVGDSNVTVSSTDKTAFTFAKSGNGFTIKNADADVYLSAERWNAYPHGSAFVWTVNKSDDTFTFYQETTANKGYLGYASTDEGVKLYCDKGATAYVTYELEEVPAVEPLKSIADIIEGKLYTIQSVDRGYFVYSSSYADEYISGSARAGYTFSATDPNCQFAFIQHDGKTYLWSKGAQKFVEYASDGLKVTANVPESDLNFLASTGSAKETHPVVLEIDKQHQCNMSTDQGQGILTNWNKTSDNGNMLRILPVADLTSEELAAIYAIWEIPNYDVVYNYMLDGEVWKTETRSLPLGSTVTAPATYAYVSETYDDVQKVVDGENVVVVTCTPTALPFTVTTDESAPVLGKLYVHSNQTRIAYVDAEGKGMDSGATGGKGNMPAEFSDGYLWYITGNIKEGFKLHNLSMDGTLHATEGQATMSGEASDVFELRYGTHGTDSWNYKTVLGFDQTNDQIFALYSEERGQYLNAQTGLKYWNAADNGSTFHFEPVEDVLVTIGSKGYATLYREYPLAVPAGVKAYVLSENEDGETLHAEEVTTIPAGTGVVLQGAENIYTFKVARSEAAESCLSGVYVDTPVEAKSVLVFNVEDGVPGFYTYDNTNLSAHKAYYVNTTGASNLRIVFDGELTGISTIETPATGVIYDLQGRRVMKAQNGIFIQNGKKVVK